MQQAVLQKPAQTILKGVEQPLGLRYMLVAIEILLILARCGPLLMPQLVVSYLHFEQVGVSKQFSKQATDQRTKSSWELFPSRKKKCGEANLTKRPLLLRISSEFF